MSRLEHFVVSSAYDQMYQASHTLIECYYNRIMFSNTASCQVSSTHKAGAFTIIIPKKWNLEESDSDDREEVPLCQSLLASFRELPPLEASSTEAPVTKDSVEVVVKVLAKSSIKFLGFLGQFHFSLLDLLDNPSIHR